MAKEIDEIIYGHNWETKRRLNRTNIDNTAASRTIADSKLSGAENAMGQIKPYLPIILAAVFAVALFSFDATAYHNSANEIDVQKAVGLFASLWATLTVVLKMQPPGESK